MKPFLVCFSAECRAKYPITEVIYECPQCGGLLEAGYDWSGIDPSPWKKLWRERRMDNSPLEQSGVWRYREAFPFLDDTAKVVTLREGNTPLLNAPHAA
jgi:threonine synthase